MTPGGSVLEEHVRDLAHEAGQEQVQHTGSQCQVPLQRREDVENERHRGEQVGPEPLDIKDGTRLSVDQLAPADLGNEGARK